MDTLMGEMMKLSSLLGLLPTCLLGLSACSSHPVREEYSNIVLGGFSPDNNLLALSYCTTHSVCRTGLFDLRQKAFSEVSAPDPDQFYIPGGFSPDGKRLAVSIRRDSDKGRDTQLGLVELSSGKLTELTASAGHRSSPSFSHDGRKIIYRRANREREAGKTRFSDWDIYELEIDKRIERRLTAFRFFLTTPPAYLPGDQSFIFSGEGPKEYISSTGGKGYDAYKAQFKENTIFVRTLGDQHPLAPSFTNGELSNFPLISGDGERIVYVARTDKTDGPRPGIGYTYDFFLFERRLHRRLTRQDDLIDDVAMSPDGSKVSFAVSHRDRLEARKLKVLDVMSGQIDILDPAQLLSQ